MNLFCKWLFVILGCGISQKTYFTILRTLTQHMAKELGVMCVTSTLEAAIITLMLVQMGATRFALDAYSIPLGGVLEVVIESLDAFPTLHSTLR